MYIVIDIGASSTKIAFFDNSKVSSRKFYSSFNTPEKYVSCIDIIKKTIKNNIQKNDYKESIVISFPGVVDRKGNIIQASNIPDYNQKPLKKELEEEFKTKVYIVQDSSCAAITELMYNDFSHYTRILHIILGTGIGAALIEIKPVQIKPIKVTRTVITPLEPGGIIVETDNGLLHKKVGMKGILESYVGGGNLSQTYNLNLAEIKDDNDLWHDFVEYLATGINTLNCLLKPELVLIGGTIARYRKQRLEEVIQKVKNFEEFVDLPVIKFSQMDDNTSILGALAVNSAQNLIINI